MNTLRLTDRQCSESQNPEIQGNDLSESNDSQREFLTISEPFRRRKIQPFPKPPVIERIETPSQKRQRELTAKTLEVHRANLKKLLDRRLQTAKEQGDTNLIRLLMAEAESLK